ncbi:MAG: ATP-binding protein [Desulfuromonadales bacterium]|jgi:predicted AAA+ superfamily ATPase|nr:ATP-binding protein [Desulfuromonadales bacterium]MDH3807948.1 ATP-binding protein [Desulfuromonadales bacterium]MDH3868194.1 ATP-binding protein [Desulfuromonadales bacterium]
MNLKPEVVEQLERVLSSVEQLLPKAIEPIDWREAPAANWRRHSFAGYLEAIEDIDETALDDLVGIDRQKKVLEKNTRQFLKGYPANNALLWGSRGTGKSSVVRALLNKYADSGLRIVQVDKHDLDHLPDIFAQIGKLPYRYIILCDDLSFEADDPGYKILKSVLDGSVYASPKNVLIYVTSNRRHLLPEFHTDNLGAKMVHNEIHHGEAVEEKISLSDRFGLWLSFYVFKQDLYLEIVQKIIVRLCLENQVEPQWNDEMARAAIKWSHEKSKRCGRTALQFARHWLGQHMLDNED